MSEFPTASEIVDRLLEAVPGGVVHVAADGSIARANPEACHILGFSFDELTSRYTQDFDGETWYEDGRRCPATDYPVTITLLERRRAGPTTIGVEQADGSIRWAVFRAVPFEKGGALVTFLDITERRAAEQRLRISDRLASLGRLAAGVAHEINNPLTWVMLSLERALSGEDVDAALHAAQQGVERVAGIVRDLSTFARNGEEPIEVFDLVSPVQQAVSITEVQLRHQALLLNQLPARLPLAVGVPARVAQILVNLLLNAAQAPPSAAPHTVTVRGGVGDGQAWIEVADNGQGMDAETLEHIFDPFFTTKPPGEGTGLGLAISHALANAMGGTLQIRSAPGQGAVARLSLPLAARAEPPAAPAPVSPLALERVLVVDDQPMIRTLVEWALRPADVVGAASVDEALHRLGEQPFDAVVCDLMMPGRSGVELHAHLVGHAPDLARRCLFITGGACTEEVRAFMAREDIAVLEKPFRTSDLVQALAALQQQPLPR